MFLLLSLFIQTYSNKWTFIPKVEDKLGTQKKPAKWGSKVRGFSDFLDG